MRMLLAAQIAAFVSCAFGGTSVSADEIDFVRDVRPILQKHCYACHAADEQKSSLRLDIKSEAFKGGEVYGPSIVAGNSQEWASGQCFCCNIVTIPFAPGLFRHSPHQVFVHIHTPVRGETHALRFQHGPLDFLTTEDMRRRQPTLFVHHPVATGRFRPPGASHIAQPTVRALLGWPNHLAIWP